MKKKKKFLIRCQIYDYRNNVLQQMLEAGEELDQILQNMMNSLTSEEVNQLQIENQEVGLALDEAVEILEDAQAAQIQNMPTNNMNQDLSDSDNDSDFEDLEGDYLTRHAIIHQLRNQLPMGIAAFPEGTNSAINPNDNNDQSQYEFDLSDGYYAMRNDS